MCACAAVPFRHPVQSMATRIRSSSMPDITVGEVSRRKRLPSSHGDDVLQPDLKKYSLVQQYNQKSAYESIKADFLRPDLQKDKTDFLKNVSRAVSKNRGHSVTLGKYSIKIGPFEDTPYKGRREMFDEWEQFYLRDHMFMEVIGVAKALPKTELVLMVCENGKVYGYEDNHLHLVSGSLKDLFERGVKFPGTRQYYRGQSFKDMTEDQCKKAKESDKVREMMEKHKNMLKKVKPSYLQSLKIIQQYKQQMPAEAAAALRDPVPVK